MLAEHLAGSLKTNNDEKQKAQEKQISINNTSANPETQRERTNAGQSTTMQETEGGDHVPKKQGRKEERHGAPNRKQNET